MNGRINAGIRSRHCCSRPLRAGLDSGRSAVTMLLKSIWPILFLTGLFVVAVYFVKYLIHRLVDHK